MSIPHWANGQGLVMEIKSLVGDLKTEDFCSKRSHFFT